MSSFDWKCSMISFFAKFKQNLLLKSDVNQYFKLASIEFFIVIIGILIALKIDNWNNQRKFNNMLLSIQQRLIVDIDNDIDELKQKIAVLNAVKPIFDKVTSQAVTKSLIYEGYPFLLSPTPYTVFNKSGVEQLKKLKINDYYSLKLIELYDRMAVSAILPLEKEYNVRANAVIESFTQYQWFPSWLALYTNPQRLKDDEGVNDFVSFFVADSHYKNQVLFNRHQIYNVYYPSLIHFLAELEAVRSELTEKITLAKDRSP